MSEKWSVAALALCLAASCGAANLQAQQTSPDNTKVNQRDRSKAEPAAGSASNKAADRDLMQKIRKSILDDRNLSTYAHNVKVIAQDGKVTLKGPVRSEAEKRTLEQKAIDAAGAGNVTNEISIKAPKKAS